MNHQDKQLSNFLSMTIGSTVDSHMANLAKKQQESAKKIAAVEDELWLAQQEKNKLEQQIKERDKRITDLGVQLCQKDNELVVLRKKLETVEADLALANKSNREMAELIQDATDTLRESREVLQYTTERFGSATTKIKDMEDAVSKLLSKVAIPNAMIEYLMLKDPNFHGKIEQWGCREGGLIRKNHYDVVKVNSAWLGFGVNGFIISKLKQESDNVVNSHMQIAKYVKLD
jgi:chromosome segregation ATPase